MAIQLVKGQRISLEKEAPGLERVMLGLGWDVGSSGGSGFFSIFKPSTSMDLDSSVLCLNHEGKLAQPEDLIYYGNLKHDSGAIAHQGDSLTGEGQGDDEQILVNLLDTPPQIERLVFTVNIYNAQTRKQDFSQVKNAFVRLVDLTKNQEIARYQLSGSTYQGKTGLIMAELARDGRNWRMTAIGEGVEVAGVRELIQRYK